MIKYLIILIIITPVFFINAANFSEADLKVKGRAIANYDICKVLANQYSDLVMAYYYADMLQDGLAEIETYTSLQHQVIERERTKGIVTLSKIKSASMNRLCQNRFDPVSRQHYRMLHEKTLQKID